MTSAVFEDHFQIPEDLHQVPDENDRSYTLTKKYDTFWAEFYKLHCHGSEIKVPNDNLTSVELKKLAETIKTCYENERYFPTKFAPPLLEACLFNREEENLVNVTQDMLMKYIEAHDREKLSDSTFDEKAKIEILEKYCPYLTDGETTGENDNWSEEIESGDVAETEQSIVASSEVYEKVARVIMYRKLKRVILAWTPILVNLINVEQFNFLMKNTESKKSKPEQLDTDLQPYEELLPHNQWKMFFYRWPDAQVEFYKNIISEPFGWHQHPFFCFRCQSQVTTKHVLGSTNEECCPTTYKIVSKERHDCILRVFEQLIDEAIERSQGFFSGMKSNWRKMIMKGNMSIHKWPRALEHLRSTKSPHIIVFNENPKKALMVEIKTCWEHYFDTYSGKHKYQRLVEAFEADGYEVRYDYIETGSRGVLRKDMYNLFTKGFGVSHEKASSAMEKISKTTIRVAFNDYNVHFELREETLSEKLKRLEKPYR